MEDKIWEEIKETNPSPYYKILSTEIWNIQKAINEISNQAKIGYFSVEIDDTIYVFRHPKELAYFGLGLDLAWNKLDGQKEILSEKLSKIYNYYKINDEEEFLK
jgi:hypothetical protein